MADVLPVRLVMFCIGLLLVSPVSKLQSAVQFSRIGHMPTTSDLATSDGSWMLFRVLCLNFMSDLALEDFAHART